jgi:drug/metabolite transporter (DMT)-like permease
VAFYRTGFAAVLLLLLAIRRHRAELLSLTRRDLVRLIGAGALLAVHFVTWFTSLSLTTVAASTVLVTLQVIFVAAGGWLFLRERIPLAAGVGIAVALGGSIVVSGGDFSASTRAFLGDLLALAGAATAGGYLLAGRALRRRISLLTYAGVVYAACAVLLTPAMLVAGTPFGGYEAADWGFFVALALGPQILGHTTFNFLLRDIDAAVVAVAIMGEPVGASLLALALFGEVPPLTAIAGGAVILAGIYVAITAQARRSDGRVVDAPVE